jgi:hypothetical protein
MKTFIDELSAFVSSLSTGEQRFSPPFQWVCLANGNANFHDNVIFFGFDANQRDPVLVAKVPRLVENGWMLKTEYDHLVELWQCMGEEAGRYVPRPWGLTTIQGRPTLVISYVQGESLTRLSPAAFWGDRGKVLGLAREAARTLRDLNHLTETPRQREEPPGAGFPIKADKFRELFKLDDDEEHALSELVKKVNEASQTASHKVLIQGDFWHGNMIRDQKRGTLMFIDWQFARWSADASPDLYFFLLAGALAATGHRFEPEQAKRAFRLLSDWRRDVIPEYLAAYGQPAQYVLLPPKHGMLLCCVEKAVRSGLEFGYSHPDDLLWRQLFGELLVWPAEI